jgi:hypothetical protein
LVLAATKYAMMPNHYNRSLFSAQKGNFFGPAAKEGIAILCPDTSPRGAGIEGEDDDWEFGTGNVSPGLGWDGSSSIRF